MKILFVVHQFLAQAFSQIVTTLNRPLLRAIALGPLMMAVLLSRRFDQYINPQVWVEDGEQRETVLTVAGGPNGSSVDLDSCERKGTGSTDLCAVWQDPDFEASQPAFYYARLRENPSCRWTQWACVDARVDCGDASTISEGFEACCTGELEPTIQERAWSSPIWYEP